MEKKVDHLLDGIMKDTKAESSRSSQDQGMEIKPQTEMPSDEPEETTVPAGLTLTLAPPFQELQETNLNPQFLPEKFKASNFPALSLQIGPWKIVSPDSYIIAKFYYGKRRIVWEMTLDGKKRKMDIEWARVSAINAIYTQGRSDTLEIELEEPPKFYFESNMPRGRTANWTPGDDFTNSYAKIYRRHTVEFKERTLETHYVKLLYADDRLYELSQRPFPTANSSKFFNWVPIKERLMVSELALHRPSASVLAMQQHRAQQAMTQLLSQARHVEAPARDVVSSRSAASSPHLVPFQTAPVLILPTVRSASLHHPAPWQNMGIDVFLSRQANDCVLGSIPVLGTRSAFRPYTNVSGQERDLGDPKLSAGPVLDNEDESIIVPENEGTSGGQVPMLLPPKKRRHS